MTTTSEQVRTHLVNVLRRDLVGPSPHDIDLATERLPMDPSRWYLTGFIGPTTDAPEATEEEDPDPEGIDVGGSPDDSQTDELRTRRNSWRPSSIGITVLVPEGISQVTAVVTWGDYRTEPPMELFLLEAQDEVDGPDQRAAPEVQWVSRPRHETTSVPIPNGRAQRGILVPNSGTPQLPGGALELTVHARPYEIELPDGAKSRFQALTVFLVNKRRRPRRRYEDISLAFQARLELVCEQGFVPRADLSGYGTDDWDRRVADLHYADAHEFAVGRNTSAEWAPLVDGRCTSASTCPLPMSEVERVAPTGEGELPGVEFGMEALGKLAAAPTSDDLSANLAPLVDLYDAWISSGWTNFGATADKRYKTGEQLVSNMRKARARIAAGIGSLKTDSQARMAFRFMNEAIAKSQRRRSPERYPVDKPGKCPKWRPFQLAFVLLNLGGLVDRTHADREIVDLLFFPTGGGKTEAYLGLAAFTIAHRRLTHPGLTGAGVAVIMRYTLRLLTLDQLSRAAGVICALELARDDPVNVDAKGQKLLGDWPIEIGLWVGRSASPNKMGGTGDTGDETAVTRVRKHRQDPARNPSPAPIKSCPWCGTDFDHNSYNCVPNSNRPTNLAIRCLNGDCDFSEDRPLPIIVVDEPIYRRLPAFIVATIDKFASLPWVGQSGAFFDHVDRYDVHGFIGASQPVGGTKLAGGVKLLPPDLIVQDELHLISGPLGTIAGLYEAAIDRLATRILNGQRVRPKIVASTATVRRAGTQIKALFDRDETQIFPPPGLTRRDSFFAVTEDTSKSPARLYLGIAAQGRGPKLIFLRVLQTMLTASKAEYDRLPESTRFIRLRNFQIPVGVDVYELRNHALVDGMVDVLRINIYLSKDGSFVTIWNGGGTA